MSKPIPIEAQIGAVHRAIEKLDALYRNNIPNGSISQRHAEGHLEQLRTVVTTLQDVQKHGVNEISKEEAQAVIIAALSSDNDNVPDSRLLESGISKLERLAE